MNIGQRVICIKTHSQGLVIRGKIYPVKGMREPFCKCKDIEINVGIIVGLHEEACEDCNITRLSVDNYVWFSSDLFAPLEEKSETMIEDILEPIYLENEDDFHKKG